MDFTKLYNQLIEDFELKNLPEDEQKEMLLEISKTIQKQFLLDVYDILDEEKFNALESSANMGIDFYGTTLKHLLPNYEEVFQESRKKVTNSFKKKKGSVVK